MILVSISIAMILTVIQINQLLSRIELITNFLNLPNRTAHEPKTKKNLVQSELCFLVSNVGHSITAQTKSKLSLYNTQSLVVSHTKRTQYTICNKNRFFLETVPVLAFKDITLTYEEHNADTFPLS